MIRRHIADAVAAGLDSVHFDRGQIQQNVRRIGQCRPVILNVLPGREMAVAAIIFPGDVRQHAHLAAREGAIGHGHPQHIGVELEIEAVHQAQRLELIFRQLT